jgi:hypothetical protein
MTRMLMLLPLTHLPVLSDLFARCCITYTQVLTRYRTCKHRPSMCPAHATW